MGMEFHFDIDLGKLAGIPEEAIPKGLEAAMEVVKAEAVERTPWETHHLQESASVSVDGDTGAVYYPGPYARYQHERLDLRHDRGGQAKYLETALYDRAQEAVDVVATEIRRAL